MPRTMRSTLATLLALTLLPACSPRTSNVPSTDFRAQEPAVEKSLAASGQATVPVLVENPNTWAPLTAYIAMQTEMPARIELEFVQGNRSWTVVADPDYTISHPMVPVFGLRAGMEHEIRVVARDARGKQVGDSHTLRWTPPPLPANFPPITVTQSMPSRMNPGYTTMSVNSPAQGDRVVMLDAEGKVVWYVDDSFLPRDIIHRTFLAVPLANGNFMLIIERRALVEMTLMGEIVGAWWATGRSSVPNGLPFVGVPVDSFHHDIIMLPPGSGADFAVLDTELRVLPNYPTSEVDPTQTAPQANVIGDVVTEFNRDGTVVRSHHMLDLLDPYRMCYDSLQGWWDDFYMVPSHDWSHGNAVTHVPADNSLLVSLRHQDAVIKIDRVSGQLRWILGPHQRWGPAWQGLLLDAVPGFEWNYHQHAPAINADGSIILFDNGNHRATPPTPANLPQDAYSRAVEFVVNEQSRTVTEQWVYGSNPGGGQESYYSTFVGDADRLPNGNVLTCDGGKFNPPPRVFIYGRVAEVLRSPLPQVVFEVFVRDSDPVAPRSHFVYRAWRTPGLYR